MHKKLYRSRDQRVILGLCGGIAQYYDIDPNLVRLIAAVVTVLTGVFPGVIAYVLGALIVPLEPMLVREEASVVEDEPAQV